MTSKFPCWDILSPEYRQYYREVEEKDGTTLGFQSWLLKHRTLANELFYDLKRLAVIKKWSKARFCRNAKELMRLKGYYFGSFRHSLNYEDLMHGVEIKDAVYPWSVISQPVLAITDKDTQDSPSEPSRLITKPCTACNEDGSRPAWGRPVSFTWDGTTSSKKYYICPQPGCTTAWDAYIRITLQQEQEGVGSMSLQCPQCLGDICTECGVIRPTAAEWYWRHITTALDMTGNTHGSKPFRRAAHQKGFKERSLTDVYAPLSVDDFFPTPAHTQASEEKEAEGTSTDLINIPGTTMVLRSQQAKAEIDEKKQMKHDMQQLFELRASTSINTSGSGDPRGRQIARIDFAPMHDRHPSDKWFSLRNRELYEESARFCARWFGDVDFPADYEGFAWLEDYGEQFVQYANLVAAEDGLAGPWEAVMRQAKHRKWLVMGVLSQIMEKKIHSELLFGASEAENQELEKQDSMFLASDGFPRTKLRSQMINMFLGDDMVSSTFWTKIDHLTNSTMAILLPLTNLLCYFRPPERWTDTLEMYAQLHSLLAQVGYFAVCMARDPSIFHVLSATPGARMDWGMEAQASYELYREGKEEAERLDKAWTEEQQARIRTAHELAQAAAGNAEAEASTARALADLERQYRVDRHHRLRGARVKYAVWPMVTRYRPENEGVVLPPGATSTTMTTGSSSRDDYYYDPRLADEDLEKLEGQRILDIGKCVVVYYQGLMYPRTQQEQPEQQTDNSNSLLPDRHHDVVVERDGVTLFDYRATAQAVVDEAARARGRRPRFAAALAAASVLVAYRAPVYRTIRHYAPASWSELGQLVRTHLLPLMWALAVVGAVASFFPRGRRGLFTVVGVVAGSLLAVEAGAWGLAGASWLLSFGSAVAVFFVALFARVQAPLGLTW